MEILAQMSSLEFYREQPELREGTYEVVEHDGEINIAVVKARNLVKWYDKAEWEEHQEDLRKELDLDIRLDSIMAFDFDDDLDNPNSDSDLVECSEYLAGTFCPDRAKALELGPDDCNDCGQCNDCCGDDLPLKNKYASTDVTIGQLLREFNEKEKVNE